MIKFLIFSLLVIPQAINSANIPRSWIYTNETICLAKNIYHEARGESIRGKLAVAKVTLNRVASGKFKQTICGVVYQRGQFSWTESKYKPILDKSAWADSLHIAKLLMLNPELSKTQAMYYHNLKVKPNWRQLERVDKIGNHVFYI
jgi:spore germination cell wall hydrolase CwlJ-like protein